MRIKIKKHLLFRALIAVTLINVLVLAFLLFNPFKEQVIVMNKDGFSPDTIRVAQNTKIIFVNKDTADRWPASNVHPTHDDYPEFDPQTPVKSHEEWEFYPEKTGTWQFHDHLLPHKKGTIIVTAPSLLQQFFRRFQDKPAKKDLAIRKNDLNIKNSEQNTQSYNQMREIVENEGTQAVWEFVLTTYGDQDGTQGSIHDIAHFAGKLIYEKDGLSGISICTPVFAFGCYHGLLDTAFSKNLDQLDEAEKACATLGGNKSGPYNACVHGIGHGVASYHKSKDLKAALNSCEKMAKEAQYSCFDGVFMEFDREAPSSFYKKEDPLSPCNTLDAKYQYPCGRNQVSVMTNRHKLSFNEIVKACSASSHRDLKNSCFVALGFQTVYQSKGDTEKIKSMCLSPKNNDFATQCLSAAAGEMMFQDMDNWEMKYIELCNALTGDSNKKCLDYTDMIRKEYNL